MQRGNKSYSGSIRLLQSELEAGLAAQQQQQAAFAVEDDKDEPLQPSER